MTTKLLKGSALPPPVGPYAVGTCSCESVDHERSSHLLGQKPGRALFLKFWYPVQPSAVGQAEPELFWQQLHADAGMPRLMKFLLRRVMKCRTHSYPGVPFAVASGPPRVLFYNHGLISFASENTLLMEHLASLGFTVIALQHKEQMTELQALQKQQPEADKKAHARLQKQLGAASGLHRAELAKQFYQLADTTNSIVAARVADLVHVVKHLKSLLGSVPGIVANAEPVIAGVFGLSLGGAVTTQALKMDSSLRCGVNIDGGIYGTASELPLRCPHLMVYSAQNSGCNELSLSAHPQSLLHSATIADTRHLNFHDIAGFYPVLRWLQMTGKATPTSVLLQRNQMIAEFFLGQS